MRDTLTSIQDDGLEVGRYDYDRSLQRTKRTTATENVEYVLDDKFVLQEADGSQAGHPATRRYHYATNALAVTDGATTSFLSVDGQGSVTDATSTGGSLTSARQYDAWGRYRNGTAPVSSEPKLGYTGHQYDTETGLIYARARYYDPELGRFLSRDAVEGSLNDAPSLNRYAYVKANPLKYIDPSGNCGAPCLIAAGAIWAGMSIGFESDANANLAVALPPGVTAAMLLLTAADRRSAELELYRRGNTGPEAEAALLQVQQEEKDALIFAAGAFVAAQLPRGVNPRQIARAKPSAVTVIESAPVRGGGSAPEAAVAGENGGLPQTFAHQTGDLPGFANSPTPNAGLPAASAPSTAQSTPLVSGSGAAGTATGIPLFRSMKATPEGVPEVGPTARQLGVRPGVDVHPDQAGVVRPMNEGMSVSPNDPSGLPNIRKPASLGGTGKDPVWCIGSQCLGEGLEYVPDPNKPTTHGFIRGRQNMSVDDFQQRLAETAPDWKKQDL